MTAWEEEFPAHEVPYDVRLLVGVGTLEDMSWKNDPAPSFGTRLRDKNWLRLWVEHQNPARRAGFPTRFTVMVQPDLAVPFGRRIAATEDLGEALHWVVETIKARGRHGRFKMLRA